MAHVSNLKPWHRPPTPSLDRGPIQRRARRAFVGSGKQVLSTSEIMRWTHPRPRPVGGLSPTRELLTRDLQRRAYFGVSAALSLGTDNYELLDMRRETIPGAARFFSAGRGITMPEPGRLTVPHWITTEAEGRKAVQEIAAHKVDIIKIWVDTRDGKYKKLTPEIYGAIIDEAHKLGLRVTAHIFDLEERRGSFAPGSTPSRTASATATSTMSWSSCSSSVRT